MKRRVASARKAVLSGWQLKGADGQWYMVTLVQDDGTIFGQLVKSTKVPEVPIARIVSRRQGYKLIERGVIV